MTAPRIALAGFWHETNTFAQPQTDYEQFVRGGLYRDEEITRQFGDSETVIAGYLDASADLGFELVPLVYAQAVPGGTVTRDAFERLAQEILDRLAADGPWDGVLLAQHGAAVAEDLFDADGELAVRVRRLVGPDVPIVLTLDLHANLTHQLVASTTALVLYRTNPHLDMRARAREGVDILVRTIRGEVHPVQALATPPLVIDNLKKYTGDEPMVGLFRDLKTVLARPGMLTASVAQGFSHADVPQMGASFLAVHDGDAAAAREAAAWLAWRAWDRRQLFVGDALAPGAALVNAAAGEGPVVLMDVGDNVGGGGPGDSTVLLREAVRRGIRNVLVVLCDPAAVAACVAAGPGSSITVAVGGKTDHRHGDPVVISGRVRVLADGRFEDTTPTHGGERYFDAGTTAVVETPDDYTIVLTSRRLAPTSLEQLYSLGVRPERKQVIVAKGIAAPRAAYGRIASRVLLVDTPGVTSPKSAALVYRHRRRPLFPFEMDAEY